MHKLYHNTNLPDKSALAVKVEQNADTLLISGQIVDSARKPYLVKELTAEPTANQKKFCPKCTLGLDIKHTDVLILSQYVRSDGCMLPQRITGLCRVQQKRIGTLVTMAQKAGKCSTDMLPSLPRELSSGFWYAFAGLMANLAPANSKRDPTKRYAWKKYNKYYDESTIKLRNRIID